jgi:hypothetical protein
VDAAMVQQYYDPFFHNGKQEQALESIGRTKDSLLPLDGAIVLRGLTDQFPLSHSELCRKGLQPHTITNTRIKFSSGHSAGFLCETTSINVAHRYAIQGRSVGVIAVFDLKSPVLPVASEYCHQESPYKTNPTSGHLQDEQVVSMQHGAEEYVGQIAINKDASLGLFRFNPRWLEAHGIRPELVASTQEQIDAKQLLSPSEVLQLPGVYASKHLISAIEAGSVGKEAKSDMWKVLMAGSPKDFSSYNLAHHVKHRSYLKKPNKDTIQKIAAPLLIDLAIIHREVTQEYDSFKSEHDTAIAATQAKAKLEHLENERITQLLQHISPEKSPLILPPIATATRNDSTTSPGLEAKPRITVVPRKQSTTPGTAPTPTPPTAPKPLVISRRSQAHQLAGKQPDQEDMAHIIKTLANAGASKASSPTEKKPVIIFTRNPEISADGPSKPSPLRP